MSRPRYSLTLLDLIGAAAGFGLALLAYALLIEWPLSSVSTGRLIAGIAISVLAVWAAARLPEHGGDDPWRFFLEQLCLGAGLSLIAQAMLAYVFLFSLPLNVIVLGSSLAAVLLTLLRALVYRHEDQSLGVVLVGCDSSLRAVLPDLRRPVLGVVSSQRPDLAGVSQIGDENQLEDIVSRLHPSHIVIALRDWTAHVSPALLLAFRRSGILVEDSPTLYERILHRVCSDSLKPADLLLSPALQADSRTMAFQSVYTNLLGLFFLLVLSPLMIFIGIAIALFSGRGPVLETIPCLGFHKIPFFLLRFRTRRRDRSGSLNPIGRAIVALHLVNLPQLVNVIRGEMALFGPRPVRAVFAERLISLMPFYSHRFSVKPGLLGWSQMHLQGELTPTDELLRMEYDLYYIKQGSPLLDCEILVRTLLGGGPHPRPRGTA